MTKTPTTDEALAALREHCVHIEYQGDDRGLEDARLSQGGWERPSPYTDGGDWEDVRRATDAEVIHALAVELLTVTKEAEADAMYTKLGRSVAAVLAPKVDADAQKWQAVRDEVSKLAGSCHPDDVLPVVLDVLRMAARKAKGPDAPPGPPPHERKADECGITACASDGCDNGLWAGTRDGVAGLFCHDCDEGWTPTPRTKCHCGMALKKGPFGVLNCPKCDAVPF